MITSTTQGFVEWRLIRLLTEADATVRFRVAAVRPRLHIDWNVAMETSLPVAERPRRPEWMKVRAPSKDGSYFDVQKLDPRALAAHDLRGGALPEHLRVLGPRHRDVPDPRRHLHPRVPLLLRALGQARAPPDPLEPLRLAQAAAQMQLKHVVVTSVDRDDVPDRGAGHYAATIRAIKAKLRTRRSRC